jgi:peptidoglycan hydrolase-like protein with peptidoglycan-binding domain
MKKLTLVLLASAALAAPAAVPAMAQGTQNQQPQAQQQQQSPQHSAQTNQQQSDQQQPNQQASNQAISPQQIGRNGVRQVQQALDKDGFHAGRADGIWGRNTRTAVNDFQKSKKIQGSGRLNQQTLSELGVNVASNQPTGNQNGGDMNAAPNQNDMNPPSQSK